VTLAPLHNAADNHAQCFACHPELREIPLAGEFPKCMASHATGGDARAGGTGVGLMKFRCPNCGRTEEILVDLQPRCRACHTEMLAPSDYSQVSMSPYIAIVRMKTISETVGVERARRDGRFKKEREAWATAVLALALTKLNGEEWWIEIETLESTPDTRLQRVEQSAGYNVNQTRCVEVVDWEENVEDVMEVIRKKCERAYPGHYLLLVHARHVGKVIDFDRIIGEMKGLCSPFLEVWVIASVGPDLQMKVVRVSPGGPAVDLNLRTVLGNAANQRAFLKRGIRGTEPGFRELGLVFLPIPGVD
jgi:uncharacterized protein (DUF983 family)